eukprot:TRINITY_DN14693_c0_g1_i1.p1 TRINITY_DN14693_c0_g1~~TRINITY_DN14693_c0_g1_i1.p1  ORF type:complete len:178 (+),score=74.07 TRINITY_DN14693_c0_g1_i1:67-534(+)
MGVSMEQVKEAFRLFDADGSGEIDQFEMKLAMQSLGWELEQEEILEMMKAIDKDESGKLSYDEFEKMMVERTEVKDSDEEAKKAFKLFDLDKGDAITVDNMVEVARQLGENAEDMRPKIQEYIEAASGGQQSMNIEQWLQIMSQMRQKPTISPRP